jgi:3'-phosphoadenosine 5'-phosphosulfate (PAPS) 3'-phosphatase
MLSRINRKTVVTLKIRQSAAYDVMILILLNTKLTDIYPRFTGELVWDSANE